MKKVLAMVGNGVSGVTKTRPFPKIVPYQYINFNIYTRGGSNPPHLTKPLQVYLVTAIFIVLSLIA